MASLTQRDLGGWGLGGGGPQTEKCTHDRFVEALVLDGNYRVFTTDGTAESQTTIHIAQ